LAQVTNRHRSGDLRQIEEEGRIRQTSNGSTTYFAYDYFLKDHLGNVRMTITDDYAMSDPIVDVTHYYPFGLAMAGISAKANGNLQNNYKFNDGTELQHQEFSDGTGLELYATDFRSYDPQIGRFHQIDPLSELAEDWSPYTFAMNNPISFLDPFGLDTVKVKIDANTGTGSATNADGSSGTYKKDENGNVVGTGMSGNGGDVTVTSHPKKDKEQSDNSGSDSKDNKDTQSPLPAQHLCQRRKTIIIMP
jgi:RHS repeat-associated protein